MTTTKNVVIAFLAVFCCILLATNWQHHITLNATSPQSQGAGASASAASQAVAAAGAGTGTGTGTGSGTGTTTFAHNGGGASTVTVGFAHPILPLPPSWSSGSKAGGITIGAEKERGEEKKGTPLAPHSWRHNKGNSSRRTVSRGQTHAKHATLADPSPTPLRPGGDLGGFANKQKGQERKRRKRRNKKEEQKWAGLDLGRRVHGDSRPAAAIASTRTTSTNATTSPTSPGAGANTLLRPVNTSTTVALAALCRDSAAFDMWLQYYLLYLKLDLLILRIEGCPTGAPCRTEIAKYPGKILAYYSDTFGSGAVADASTRTDTRRRLHASDANAGVGNSASIRNSRGFFNETHHTVDNNYHSMIDRQVGFIDFALNECRARGIDFLIHSDADELLYVQPSPSNPSLPRSEQLRVVVSQLPMYYDNIHLENFEAVYPSVNMEDGSKCFVTDRYKQCVRGGCKSYANGKAIARVMGHGWKGGHSRIRAHGPHWFSGKSYDYKMLLPINPELAVLHFDSCTVEQWEAKFWLLKDINSTNLEKIPFNYYRESIRLQQYKHAALTLAAATSHANSSRVSAEMLHKYRTRSKSLYRASKVDTYYRGNYMLMRYWDKGNTQEQQEQDQMEQEQEEKKEKEQQKKLEQGQGPDINSTSTGRKDRRQWSHARVKVKFDREIYPQFHKGEEAGRRREALRGRNISAKAQTQSSVPITTIEKWHETESTEKRSHAPDVIKKVLTADTKGESDDDDAQI